MFRVSESKHRREDDRLADAIELLAKAICAIHKHDSNTEILMKLSEIKNEVAAAAADSAEAFSELATRISDLDKQVADLVAAASDPDVTDEVFLTNLTALRASSQQLRDIIPGSPIR